MSKITYTILYRLRKLGFDAIAKQLKVKKAVVKQKWNDYRMGWKMYPNTLLEIKRLSQGKYELSEDVVMYVAEDMPIIAPKGFVFDYASVPRFLWWFIAPDDDGIALPALLHDLIYTSELFSRAVCDAIFLQAMQERGLLPWWKRWLTYLAVRAGGWYVWNKHVHSEVLKNKTQLMSRIKNYRARKPTSRVTAN